MSLGKYNTAKPKVRVYNFAALLPLCRLRGSLSSSRSKPLIPTTCPPPCALAFAFHSGDGATTGGSVSSRSAA